MNILREYRRVMKKNMLTRISLLCTFSVILIINTYAWFNINEGVDLMNLHADVTPWDVSYYINESKNEILDEIATFSIDELYPRNARTRRYCTCI